MHTTPEVGESRSEASGAAGALTPAFESPLLTSLSLLVNRWSSTRFQTLHLKHVRNRLGISANNTLYYLAAEGPSRPSDLADWLGTGRANVSKVVNNLVGLGLVARVDDPSDGRAQLVTLTAAGDAAGRELFEAGDVMFRELVAGVPEEELAVATRVMAQVQVRAALYEARLAGEARRLDEGDGLDEGDEG